MSADGRDGPGRAPDPEREIEIRLKLMELAAVHASMVNVFAFFDVDEDGSVGLGSMSEAFRKVDAALRAVGVAMEIPERAQRVLDARRS